MVRTRIVGAASFGWLDAARLWGASVEVLVTRGGKLKNIAHQLYPDVLLAPPAFAIDLPPHRHWDGSVLTTITSQEDADDVDRLTRAWRPLVCLVAFHSSVTRRQMSRWLPLKLEEYSRRVDFRCCHDAFGGVTSSVWNIWLISKLPSCWMSLAGMTDAYYPRSLQTALDDTLGPSRQQQKFSPNPNRASSVDGYIIQADGQADQPVYKSTGLGPDLNELSDAELASIWVRAESVFAPKPVLRKLERLETMALWDYAGKIWYNKMHPTTIGRLLVARRLSPPAKILTALTFTLSQQILDYLLPQPMEEAVQAPKASQDPPPKSGLEGAEGVQRVKAAVADNAAIDLSYWAMPGETISQADARVVLRRVAKRWWAHHLKIEADRWIKAHGHCPVNLEAAADCIRRAEGSDYWDWHRGSRLFFWRFPVGPDYPGWLEDARDGIPFFHRSNPPKGMHFQNIPCSTREGELQLRSKIFTLLFRWQIEKGYNDLVIPTFPVEKFNEGGIVDIRAVWDAKRNGLNATLWAPSFCMPTTKDAADLVVKWLLLPVAAYFLAGCPPQDYTQDESLFIKSYQFDEDVGQMFHNFLMHASERHSHAVRFTHTRNNGSFEPHSFYRWCVLNFGCLLSPYLAGQGEERIMELCMGNPEDDSNPFQWDQVLLNLPFTVTYDPSMPRVMLITRAGELATRKVVFVDDTHGAGRGKTSKEATRAQRILAKRMNYYGNQAAARKRRPACLLPGAWNGVIIHCARPHPVMSTTVKKWTRGLSFLDWVWAQFGIPDGLKDPIAYLKTLPTWDVYIDTAELRRAAGLWIHITEVYREGRCFTKGMFNCMEAFRGNRDVDGWKLFDAEYTAAKLEEEDASRRVAGNGYPLLSRATYELVLHIYALKTLFHGDEPRQVQLRPKDAHLLRLMGADASAEGFGAAVQYPELVIEERDGLWTEGFAQKSSNTREGFNIGNHLKKDISDGKFDGCEAWVGTDNSTWSAVCTKGMSSVRHLFYLWVEINRLAFEHNVFLHCFHISGARMIATGIDGLSRGDRDAGITLGYDLRDFVPLGVSAFDYPDNSLETWCKSWMGDDYNPPLQPKDWFLKGQLPGVHVWAPPAAAALIALKELARSRHKRPQHLTHVVLIPRLLYQEEWRKRFEKEVDIWFALSPVDVWPHSAFEPLMVGISFPLYRTYPWLLRLDQEKVVGIGRTLSSLSKGGHLQVGYYLRKLWSDPRSLPQV